MKENLSFNGSIYKTESVFETEEIFLSVENPSKKEPTFLFKYYPLKAYSAKSLLNNYLFSSHPTQLNDKYDCCGDLIDYSKLDIEAYNVFLCDKLKVISREEIKLLFHSENKWILERTFSEFEKDRLYMKFGVISMTENERNILMWSYYSHNTGFVLKYKVDLLPKEFYGPFPVNYVGQITRLDDSKYTPVMSMLYQTNVKHDVWQHENEWRYITYNKKGNFHPFFNRSDIASRKFEYNKECVKEIILGYDFFKPDEMKDYKDYRVLKFNKSNKLRKLNMRILNHIIDSKLDCFIIKRKTDEYCLAKQKLYISKLKNDTYKLKYDSTIIY